MGWGCGTYGGEEKCTQGWWGNLKGESQLENLGVDEFIQLKWLLNWLG
jgi:hypothetical protein